MNISRTIKIAALVVVICSISLLCVSCGKGDGDTSGNAPSGIVSNSDKSEGGTISEIISAGGEVVSRVEDAVSDIISGILPDSSHSSDMSEASVGSEEPSTVSFASEGEISNL